MASATARCHRRPISIALAQRRPDTKGCAWEPQSLSPTFSFADVGLQVYALPSLALRQLAEAQLDLLRRWQRRYVRRPPHRRARWHPRGLPLFLHPLAQFADDSARRLENPSSISARLSACGTRSCGTSGADASFASRYFTAAFGSRARASASAAAVWSDSICACASPRRSSISSPSSSIRLAITILLLLRSTFVLFLQVPTGARLICANTGLLLRFRV